MKRLFVLFGILFCLSIRAETFNINWYVDRNTYAQTTCESGGDITLPDTPAKRGYTFNGWKYYIPVEYIESNGSQYINTGVVFNGPDAEVVLKFIPSNVNKSGRYSYTGAGWTFTANVVQPGKLGFYHGSINASTRTDLQVNISANTTYVIDAVQKNGVFSYDINGTTNSASTVITYPDYPYILFGTSYNPNSIGNERSEMKLYYAKIYDNNILVRDFIPVLDQDGTPCLWDKVTEQFFYNQGSSNFIAGPAI